MAPSAKNAPTSATGTQSHHFTRFSRAPQLGQAFASVLISLPHSRHGVRLNSFSL